jgi:hypothetical protein
LKHVDDLNKYIIEEVVRQVGYLPELYEESRSENKLQVLLGTLSPVTVVPDLQTPADFHM